MKKYLIVNADDFGLLESVNNGITKAFREGIVTGASIMPTGKAFEHAVMLSKENKDLDIGVHLSLIQDTPVSPFLEIPTLVDQSNNFYKDWRSFFFQYFLGRMDMSQIEQELDAQIRKVFDAGLSPTYLDSHQHIHVIPSIWKSMNRLAHKHKIRFIRYPNEMSLSGCISFQHLLKLLCIRVLMNFSSTKENKPGIEHSDYFIGLSASGKISINVLKKYLKNLKSGVTELMCHPGDAPESDAYSHWDYRWQQELDALKSPNIMKLIKELDINPINYQSLLKIL